MRVAADCREAIRRSTDLTRRIRITEFTWVSPHDHRQSLTFLISRWQIQSSRQLYAVFAFVGDELALNTAEFWLWILEFSDRAFGIGIKIANVVIRRVD